MEVIAPVAPAARPVLYFHPDARVWVGRWQDRFELCERAERPADPEHPTLWAAADHLELLAGGVRGGARAGAGAWVTEAEVRRRVRQAPELLRACGLRSGMRVLDAMAGWGLDGMVLAGAGAAVTMVEREPLMQVLQEDLIRRMSASSVQSMQGDGYLHLEHAHGFDVIYLDPMFPERGKGALPGKRMQYLAALVAAPTPPETPTFARAVTDDRPLCEWVERATAVARRRVVVKRRLHDVAVVEPDWQIRGRSVRYDVYRGRGSVSAPAEQRSESPDL